MGDSGWKATNSFQKKNGLSPSGQLNTATINAMNGPSRDRQVDTILANLERFCGRTLRSQALRANFGVGVESRSPKHTDGNHLGAGSRRARRRYPQQQGQQRQRRGEARHHGVEVRALRLRGEAPLGRAHHREPRRVPQGLERHAQQVHGRLHESRLVARVLPHEAGAEPRGIGHRAREHADRIERRRKRQDAGARDGAEAGLVADDAAEGRGPDHRAERLRADRDRPAIAGARSGHEARLIENLDVAAADHP